MGRMFGDLRKWGRVSVCFCAYRSGPMLLFYSSLQSFPGYILEDMMKNSLFPNSDGGI
jgi:hypothetical protein